MQAIFTVNGAPEGKARPRVTTRGTYTPHKTAAYEKLVQMSFRAQCPGVFFGGEPLCVYITANFAPLLFLTFHKEFGISLGKIALISTVFYFTQLIVDVFCAKFVDRIGYRRSVVASEVTSALGLIGLAVMGENLVMNMESKGFTVAVFNRTTEKVKNFVEGRGAGKNIIGTYSMEELVASIEKPRKIMMMIKAGGAVDATIEALLPLLDDGDIIIDGGNSHFPDTIRRTEYVESKGKLYIGCGVSGGEEGALNGPSLMPGGSPAAWESVKPIMQAICAKVEDGSPCCDWVGENGAGHFVKMVHNGIEYGDMQLICEAYHLMKNMLGMSDDEMHEVFAEWMKGDLDSYLIEITRDILAYKDTDGEPIVEKILDTAGQKGTGKWTGIAALDEGVPLTLIGEAVFARCLSAMKDERVEAAKVLPGAAEAAPKFTAEEKAQ